MKGRNTVYEQKTVTDDENSQGILGDELSPKGFDEARLSVIAGNSGELILQAKIGGQWVDYASIGTRVALERKATQTGRHVAFLLAKVPCAECVRAVFMATGAVADGFEMSMLLLARN